jgi:hypothetical protein
VRRASSEWSLFVQTILLQCSFALAQVAICEWVPLKAESSLKRHKSIGSLGRMKESGTRRAAGAGGAIATMTMTSDGWGGWAWMT